MATLPSSASRRINPADYKGAPDFFTGRFLAQLNLFMEPVYLSLLNGLTFVQNFNAQYFTQILKAGSTPASNAFSFKTTIQGTPVEVVKVACNVSSDPTAPLTAAFDFSWYTNAGSVFITGISGLTAGTTYTIVLRIC